MKTVNRILYELANIFGNLLEFPPKYTGCCHLLEVREKLI